MLCKVRIIGHSNKVLILLTKAANDDVVDWVCDNLENEADGAEDKETNRRG